jgi:pimeloyl-ACP methyl ester carboxylesterase
MRNILLLHGALGSKSQLDPLKISLEGSGYKVYSLDFSGHHGEPFQKAFGIETFTSDVITFLEKNQLKQADIFGYSMGGYVALWLAHQHPEYAGKIVTLGTKFDWTPESAAREIKKVDPDKIQEKIPAFARILESRHQPNDWRELLYRTAAMMLKLGSNPLLTESVFQKIQQDVLILLGDLDDMADLMYSKKAAQSLPNGKFASLEKTPHPIERVDVKFLHRILTEFFGKA